MQVEFTHPDEEHDIHYGVLRVLANGGKVYTDDIDVVMKPPASQTAVAHFTLMDDEIDGIIFHDWITVSELMHLLELLIDYMPADSDKSMCKFIETVKNNS